MCHCLLSVEGGCPSEAGVCTLVVEACVEAAGGPGRPGNVHELLSSEAGIPGHWSCV